MIHITQSDFTVLSRNNETLTRSSNSYLPAIVKVKNKKERLHLCMASELSGSDIVSLIPTRLISLSSAFIQVESSDIYDLIKISLFALI